MEVLLIHTNQHLKACLDYRKESGIGAAWCSTINILIHQAVLLEIFKYFFFACTVEKHVNGFWHMKYL